MANLDGRGLLALRIASGLSALTLLFYTFHRVDFSRVSESMAEVGFFGFCLIATPQLVSLCLECVGWSHVFSVLGRRVSPRALLRVRLATEAVAQTLPLGVIWAESLKPLLLRRHAGVDTCDSLAAIVARKYLLMASQAAYVALISALGFVTLRQLSSGLFGHEQLAWCAFAVSALLALLAFGVSGAFTGGRVADRVLGALRAIPNLHFQRTLRERQSTFASTDRQTARFFSAGVLKSRLFPGLFFLAGWLCESVESYLILKLLGVTLGFFEVASIEAMLSFAKNVAFVVPAGIGVQDVGYVSCLTALGVHDSLNLGAAFSVLKRGKELFWATLGYLLLATEARPNLARPRLSIDIA